MLIIFFFFFFLIDSQYINFLIFSEFVWLLFYTICCISFIFFNVIYVSAISLLILVLASLEFGIGILLFYFL